MEFRCHHNRFAITRVALGLGFLLLTARLAPGATYYVAPTGSDDPANPGTVWSSPLLSISNGVAKAVTAGDFVTVSNGTYTISTQIVVSSAITIRSWNNGVVDRAGTIVNGGGAARCGFSMSTMRRRCWRG